VTSSSRRDISDRPPLVRRPAPETGVRRLRWLLGIFALIAALIVAQLVRVQVIDDPGYAEMSAAQRARTIDLAGDRGRIYDRDGEVLATTVQAATVYADPRAFRPGTTPQGTPVPPATDPAEAAAALAPLLDLDASDLEERMTRESHFVYLGRQLDHEVGVAIRELELDGIGVIAEPQRVYPASSLAGQVVGFTGIDGEGLQGLEARYEDLLLGRPGMLALERAPGGLDISSGVRELVPSEPGTDLVLTLDRDVQAAAERAAADVTEEYSAAGASVVVMEVATGDVLAMASAPSFDPNQRADADPATWRNRAVTDVFEPGSVQKAFTVAAAIEEGLVDEHSRWTVPRSLEVSGKSFTDSTPQATQERSLTEVMERSSNVGTIQIAQELGPERLERYLRSFGEGSSLGTGFPGEASGLLMPSEQWWGTSLPTISIGQGVAVTLMQMANGYATLANDGVATTPRIVRGTVGDDGRLTPSPGGAERRVVSADTAQQVQRMLEAAVSGEEGTGGNAEVDGYRVAGKTGTARKPSADSRGYSGEYVASFAGFAPADDPQLVVAVMVDEPRPFYGGVVAAPVFSEVMQVALASRRVVPDGVDVGLEQVIAQTQADADAREDEDGDESAPERAAGPTPGAD
jgi:cell division protein FtsI (penicillin-binding protein 3)